MSEEAASHPHSLRVEPVESRCRAGDVSIEQASQPCRLVLDSGPALRRCAYATGMERRAGYDEVERAARAVHDSAAALGTRVPGSSFVTTVLGEMRQLEYDLEGAPEGALGDFDRTSMADAADALADFSLTLGAVRVPAGQSDVTLEQEHMLMGRLRQHLRTVKEVAHRVSLDD